MEFNEKLQSLRKQKNLTQEEVAKALFVSRTAISKWESGRGFPGIDSLKAIASFYHVSVDELLSGDEILTLAENEGKEKENRLKGLVFGLLDLFTLAFLFLPLFGDKTKDAVQSASLLTLGSTPLYLKISYLFFVFATALFGVLTLTLQPFEGKRWKKAKSFISLLVNAAGVLLFTASLQPYAAVLLLLFLFVKIALLIKKQ